MHRLVRLHTMRKERGVLATLGCVRQALSWEVCKLNPVFRRRLREDLGYDRRYGTDTCGTIYLDELCVSTEDRQLGNRYEPAHPWVVRDYIEHLPVELGKYAYIDLGSGKGRALLLAAHYPFIEIVGVELAPELHAVAQRNIEIYAAPGVRCSKVRSYCGNAAQFAFPNTNLVISVFNSFKEEILRAVLNNLIVSLCEIPRAAYFVYINPLHRSVIEESGLFEAIRIHRRYVTYAFCSPRLPAVHAEPGAAREAGGDEAAWAARAPQPVRDEACRLS